MIITKDKCFIDLDGVLADFVGSAKEYCNKIYGKTVPDSWMGHDLSEEEYLELITSTEFYSTIFPISGAKEITAWLKDNQFEVIILTGRYLPIGITVEWLIKNKITFDNVLNRSKKERIQLAKDIYPTLFIEDNFDTAVKIKDYCTFTIVKAYSWSNFTREGIILIDSLEEIKEIYGVKI